MIDTDSIIDQFRSADAALFACLLATVWHRVKQCALTAPRKLAEAVTARNVGELCKALRGEAWQ